MADVSRRDAFLGLLTKMVVDNAATIPAHLLEADLHIRLVVVPRMYEKVLDRKMQEMSAEMTALEYERTNTKDTVN